MPSKIRVLDEHTINKIAAGEVIENAASVVKELVENSLDAGATDICIEIKGGGRQLIRITDNGCGMNNDDALLCLERHATSKIRDVEDIHAIGTMGFRGEAIPSIASISKFTLITCDTNSGTGTMVIIEGGRVIQCCPVARSQGTTIEVKSLFFNVPVRKKFQRSPAYDVNEILKIISSIALGYPQIKFQLISDQKDILSTHFTGVADFPSQLGERVQEILGTEFYESTCFIEGSKEEYRLQGYIGLPENTRHNRTGQYLFINQRSVHSPLISFSVRDGYGTTLSTNRHAVYVLHLTIPGTLVDVNVHPQKREVRLRQEQALKEMIVESVRKGLQKVGRFTEICFPNICHSSLPSTSLNSAQMSSDPFVYSVEPIKRSYIDLPRDEALFVLPPLSSVAPASQTRPALSMVAESLLPFSIPSAPQTLRVLTTIKHYIVIDGSSLEQPSGITLINQRAAHARIIFEKLCKQKDQPLEVQALLLPYTFETTPLEGCLLLESLKGLNELGMSIRQSGPHTFLIDAIPHIFGNSDLQSLLGAMIQNMHEAKENQVIEKIQEKQIAMAASRAAVSNNRRLTLEEAQLLIDQLMKCESPYQCPMGKPTMITISQDELVDRFQNRRSR